MGELVRGGGADFMVAQAGASDITFSVGTQQLLIVLVLQHVASTASALSFSIGLQVGVTITNTLLGLAALALFFGSLRPAAIRTGLRRPA